MQDHRDDDRPKPVSGETGSYRVTEDTSVTMPATRQPARQGTTNVHAVVQDAIDVDSISALLNSHAQIGKVKLSIVFPDGRTFFESCPPDAQEGPENEVPLEFPRQPALMLRGALPVKNLEQIGDVLERITALQANFSSHLNDLIDERKRLSLIFEFSEEIYQLLPFDSIISRFLGSATRILEAKEATFFVIDQKRHDLYIHAHHGTRPEIVDGFRLKIGEGITGAVAKDGLPRIVNSVENCPDYVVKGNPIRNIIAAPVKVRGNIIGVINVNDRRGERNFSNRDLQLLVSLARLGGVALENARLFADARGLLLAIVDTLTAAIDAKDRLARGHSNRVAFLCGVMASRLGLKEQEKEMLHFAAMLHDVGNLAVSETILRKEGPLTVEERSAIKEHPALGGSILSPLEQLLDVLPGVVDHHERYDGRGYPRRLKGEEISLQGRLVAIADAFDAMTHDRPFRKSIAAKDALSEIIAEAGTQFDPALVPIFVETYHELELDDLAIDEMISRQGPELDF